MKEHTTKSAMSIGGTAVIVAIFAVALGGGIYAYVNSKATKEKNALHTQITALQEQVAAITREKNDLYTQVTALQEEVATITREKNALRAQITKLQKKLTKQVTTVINTTDWQTYTSKEFGYLIKFPKNLYYKGNKVQPYLDGPGGQDLIISNVQNMGIQDVLPSEKIHIDVLVSPSGGRTLEQIANDYKRGGTISDEKNIMFGSARAIQFAHKYTYNGHRLVVYTFALRGNFVYILRATNGIKDDTTDSPNYVLMKKIIETFRFSS